MNTDPVTLNNVNDSNAYYLRTDVGKNRKITAIYKKSTLDELVNRRQMYSPMTRKPFIKDDIRKVPIDGRVHPEFENNTMWEVLGHPDTTQYVINKMKTDDLISFVPERGSVPFKIYYKKTKGEYYLRLDLGLSFKTRADLEIATTNLAEILKASKSKHRKYDHAWYGVNHSGPAPSFDIAPKPPNAARSTLNNLFGEKKQPRVASSVVASIIGSRR
jgi:hypothetical protein